MCSVQPQTPHQSFSVDGTTTPLTGFVKISQQTNPSGTQAVATKLLLFLRGSGVLFDHNFVTWLMIEQRVLACLDQSCSEGHRWIDN
jgi:hypothetical protein